MTLRQLIFFFLFLLVGVSCKSGKKSATSISHHSRALFTQSAQIQTMNRRATAPTDGLACRENEDCEIKAGETRWLTTSVNVKKLTINGTLRCDPILSGELKADVIYVNGTFECGTERNRFMGQLKISLKDSGQEGEAYRGFIVNRNGVLKLHGNTKNSGFVKLIKTARPGETSIDLERSNKLTGASPSSWEEGDTIVVASTSFEPSESEIFSMAEEPSESKIFSMDDGLNGTSLNLVDPLKSRHHGETKTYQTLTGSKILDERAEVANLTRNILIRADGTVTNELGGHVMVHKGGKAFIDSVEFYQMGQAGRIGRYPFHWHLVGNARDQYIKNSSIHHSFQRCVIIHQTDWAYVENNVCYNFKGHGFMLEDGVEKNNTLQKNLAIYADFPNPTKALRESEKENGTGIEPSRFPGVSSFWISHPTNWVMDNIASGSVGTGFWNSFAGRSTLRAPTHQFSGNIAHTTLVGHTWDGAEALREVKPAHYNPKGIPMFSGLQAFKNKLTGIYYRGSTAIFRDAILADNRWSLFLAHNNIIERSLVVGEYQENAGGAGSPTEYVGIVLYDGPWELNTIDFKAFDRNKENHLPIKTVGGVDKWTNVSEKLAFEPEPKFRVYHKNFDHDHKKTTIGDMWVDFVFANSIRDKDGSLTGEGPGVIVPNAELTRHSGCHGSSKFFGMVYCPDTTRTFHARVNLSTDHFKTIFDVSRDRDSADNSEDLPTDWKNKVGTQDFFNKKFLMVSDPSAPETGIYTVTFPSDTRVASLVVRSEKRGERSPIIRMVREGSSKVCEGRVHTTGAEREHLIKKSNRRMKIGVGTMKCVW